jgi:hypothetical protein
MARSAMASQEDGLLPKTAIQPTAMPIETLSLNLVFEFSNVHEKT